MKSLIIIGLILFSSSLIAKNDTVYISNLDHAMEFDTYFSGAFASLAKEQIPLMMKDDPDNFKPINASIKSLIANNQICDVNAVIPIVKQYGSLKHILNYKKMFHIYFQEVKARLTWAQSVYYIIDDQGYFVYVEFKDVYHDNKHLIFNQALLKSVRVNKSHFKKYGYKIP